MDLRPSSTIQKGRHGRRGKGPYVGVRLRGGRWVSEIRVPRTSIRIWLGSHHSAEKAALAYDAALYCLKGEEGFFNFPHNKRPDLGDRQVGSLSVGEVQRIAAEFSFSEEMVATPGPSTILPPQLEAHLTVAPTAISDLINLNEMPVVDVEGELCATGCTLEVDPHVPTVAPEELHLATSVPEEPHLATSVPEEKQYVPPSVPEEPYIPTFVPEEELRVPAFAPQAASFLHGVAPLDEWFATDEDWMKIFHL
ncbi:hypothetical protein NMG60_11005103 [Bertholletia excelsa]